MRQTILKRLYEIKERPGMYLGQKSLMYLFFYMTGYQCRENEIRNGHDCLLPGFQEFVQERYNVKSTHSWASIIKFYETTEEVAFDKFYVLLEEFLKSKAETQ